MSKLSLVALIISAMLFSASTYAAGVGSANVKFGKPGKSTSDCAGKGICMLSLEESGGNTIKVNFSIMPDAGGKGRTLIMQFGIEEMERVDKEYLYDNFLTSRGRARDTYAFDATYTFDDKALCEQLGVAPGSVVITSSTVSKIEKLFETDIRVSYHID